MKNVTPKSGWEKVWLLVMAVLAFVVYWTGWLVIAGAGLMVAFGWALIRIGRNLQSKENG